MIAWRLVKARYATTAFNGHGASLAGGRWNSRGVELVYTSHSLSLAMLENLVHIHDAAVLAVGHVAIKAEFDSSLCKGLKDLRWMTARLKLQEIGDRWVREGDSCVLAVPSAIVPLEMNLLINPAHQDFHRIVIHRPVSIPLDPRLK